MPDPKQVPQRDVVADLKALRLYGMASAWWDRLEYFVPASLVCGRW